MKHIFVPLYLLTLICLFAPMPATAVTIAWSRVGNPGNANDPADGDSDAAGVQNYGAVPYAYNIGKYDVTTRQYVEFLNAKDPTGANTLGLYHDTMSHFMFGGISFIAGNANGSKYGVVAGRGNHPANYTNWYDAIRFTNWMNNGQGSSDTETGAYTLGTLGANGIPITPPLTHNAGSQIWLPTENEWYKAAYYNPSSSSYTLYPTSSNLAPTASSPTALVNHANYNSAVGDLTDVGAYTGTTSAYGAFDMGGNVSQWNEALIGGESRSIRGGSFDNFTPRSSDLRSSLRLGQLATHGDTRIGFRMASVPEPTTFALGGIVAALLGLGAVRRRKLANAVMVQHASGLPVHGAALLLALASIVSLAVPTAHAELLVSSWENNRVLRYDNAGNFIDTFITAGSGGLTRPYQIVFGPDHNLYVGSAENSKVLRYNGATGQFIAPFAFGGGLQNLRGSIFGPDGNLYVSNPDGGPMGANIMRFNGTTGALMGGFASGGGLDTPLGLTFGPDQNLYVSNGHGRNVLRYNGTSGAFMNAFVSVGSGGLNNPEGLVFGPDGNLYVVSVATNSILRYHGTTGSFMGAFVPSGKLNTPYGLVFGPDKNLYVSSASDNRILRFDGTTGAFLNVFITPGSGGLSSPTFLTFTPVPESSSIASLGTGALCLLGYGLRYGRSRWKAAA